MKAYNALILIVEDEPNDQALIRLAFEANGVTTPIQVANNGLEAIEYLMGEGQYADRERFPYPSFILTDLKMPQADGFEVLRHLKNNPQWAAIPVVVLTASSDPDDIKKAYMLGARAYHVKPNNFDQLAQQLKLLHNYWSTCQVPEVDLTGQQLTTESGGKLGQRFPQPARGGQKRVKS